jgi:hypothetical protein
MNAARAGLLRMKSEAGGAARTCGAWNIGGGGEHDE